MFSNSNPLFYRRRRDFFPKRLVFGLSSMSCVDWRHFQLSTTHFQPSNPPNQKSGTQMSVCLFPQNRIRHIHVYVPPQKTIKVFRYKKTSKKTSKTRCFQSIFLYISNSEAVKFQIFHSPSALLCREMLY